MRQKRFRRGFPFDFRMTEMNIRVNGHILDRLVAGLIETWIGVESASRRADFGRMQMLKVNSSLT
jgi:hypothetical protein